MVSRWILRRSQYCNSNTTIRLPTRAQPSLSTVQCSFKSARIPNIYNDTDQRGLHADSRKCPIFLRTHHPGPSPHRLSSQLRAPNVKSNWNARRPTTSQFSRPHVSATPSHRNPLHRNRSSKNSNPQPPTPNDSRRSPKSNITLFYKSARSRQKRSRRTRATSSRPP